MIKSGDVVIVKMHDEASTCMLRAFGEQKLGRSKINVNAMIGEPYGTVFEIQDRKMVRVDDESDFDRAFSEDLQNMEESNPGTVDNRDINDRNDAQKMTCGEITNLRESGASGVDIIKNLVANSDTWTSKTTFAQKKWLKRKMKKYVRRVRIEKCTPATICAVYHSKSIAKVLGIRWDTLAQMLSQGNVCSGRRVLIFESVLGLIVGSAGYRLKGRGRIVAAYGGQQPHFELAERLNLTDSDTHIIHPVPCNELGPAASEVSSKGFTQLPSDFDSVPVSKEERPLEEWQWICTACKNQNFFHRSDCYGCAANRSSDAQLVHPSKSINKNNNVAHLPYNCTGRRADQLPRTRQILRAGFDSLIIASKYSPLLVLQQCISLLVPSSPFVVYSEFQEPLLECYAWLVEIGLAIKLNIFDSWMREYQTLPGRLHPFMSMSVTGGFLLTGIFVGSANYPREG
jgi:tRNA (adenine-N(1)-)-methyltransferase non-catalytic subunit